MRNLSVILHSKELIKRGKLYFSVGIFSIMLSDTFNNYLILLVVKKQTLLEDLPWQLLLPLRKKRAKALPLWLSTETIFKLLITLVT